MRINRVLFVALAALGLTSQLFAHVAHANETAADNYKTYCSQCHGSNGDGKGVNARDLSVQPRDHTDAKAMSARSDEHLIKVIREGGRAIDKSILMPEWDETLSAQEIRDLVLYLRELCKCKYGK